MRTSLHPGPIMLQSYRPSNRFPAAGLLFLILTIICGGLVFGGLAFALSRFFWLIIVFPIGLGLMAGTILAFSITKRHIRHPVLCIVAGIAMGMVIYGTFHYAKYLTFHAELQQMLGKQYDLVDTSVQNQMVDAFLEIETGNSGFFGYLNLMAQEGISIGKIGRSRSLTLNQPLTWGYWLIEFSLIGGITALIARTAAKKPFCESCQQWYQDEEHLGSILDLEGQQFLAYVNSGSFQQASTLILQGNSASPSFEVYVRRCLHADEHPAILVVRHASKTAKGTLQFKDVLEGMISAYDVSEIMRGRVEQQVVLS